MDYLSGHRASRESFGRRGYPITPNDAADMDPMPKAVVVTDITGGDVLQILPSENLDGEWLTFTGVTPGFSPQYQVRRVGQATTCAVASDFR